MVISLPKSRVVRKRSRDGEIHLILPEYYVTAEPETAENIDEEEIRTIMKKEASKPLLLLRAE